METTKTTPEQPPLAHIYLSGKFGHWPQMSLYMRELEEMRCVITWDWTSEKARALDPPMASYCDISGVRSCDALVVVLDDPAHPYRGTFCELGAALALSKPVLLCNLLDKENKNNDIGDDGRGGVMQCVFVNHPCVFATVTSWAEAKRVLLERLQTGL